MVDATADPQNAVGRLRPQRTRAFLWLTLIFWGSNLVFLNLGTLLAGNPQLGPIAAVRLMTTLLGLVFCYLIHLLLTRPFLTGTRKRLIALAIVAPLAAECFAWASFFAEAAVDPALKLSAITWSGAVRAIAFWSWFFLAWAGLYLALSYSFDVREEQQRTAEIREQAHAAQLRALHSQINPHFLFNSLNSLSSLILDRKFAQAEDMVAKLASFLRLGLAANTDAKVPLSSEIDLQQVYLELEQVRYDDLLTEFHIPEPLGAALVPALILQPVIENAVKYGVAGSPPPAKIVVEAQASGGRLLLQVTDSGKGCGAKKSQSGGIGLANVKNRLALIYGEDRGALFSGRLDSGEFRVAIEMPLEFA